MSELIVDRDKFALLRGAQRIWTIASIHGEAGRLAELHSAIASRLCRETAWFTSGTFSDWARRWPIRSMKSSRSGVR